MDIDMLYQITKLRSSNAMLMDIVTLNVLENAFCMYLDIIVQKHLKMRSKLRCMQFAENSVRYNGFATGQYHRACVQKCTQRVHFCLLLPFIK